MNPPLACHAIAIAACLLQISAAWLCGQANEIIYSNSLQNGWVDESWATDNLANTNPVLSGFSDSISVFCTEYAALYLSQTPSSSTPYTNLTFWLNGGATGGQVLTVTGTLDQAPTRPLIRCQPWPPTPGRNLLFPCRPLAWPTSRTLTAFGSGTTPISPSRPFMLMTSSWWPGLPPPPPPPPPPPQPITCRFIPMRWSTAGQDSSYNCTLNYANTSPVYSGSTDSISATITSAYGGIQLYHAPMTNTAYASISFWLNGGADGGQHLQMYGHLGRRWRRLQSARYSLNTPLANTWQQYTVPLSALGVANATNFTGFAIQDSAGSAEPTFYLDDIQLVSAARRRR